MTKTILTKTIITRKDFSYEQKGVNLKFNLPIDTSSELQSFKSCLEEAIKDIDKILEGMKN
jgi:hypothetical protein